MRNRLFLLLCLCAALLTHAPAMAAAPAAANQELTLYAAPGSTPLFSLPAGFEMIAIHRETFGNTEWILAEMLLDGLPTRGYVESGNIACDEELPSFVSSDSPSTVVCAAQAYAAPAENAPVRSALPYMTRVMVLGFDGAYVFIQYDDPDTDTTVRGWTNRWALSIDDNMFYGDRLPPTTPYTGTVSIEKRCTALTTLFSEPDPACTTTLLVPENAVVQCYGELYCGYSIVQYNGSTGYIPTSLLTDTQAS